MNFNETIISNNQDSKLIWKIEKQKRKDYHRVRNGTGNARRQYCLVNLDIVSFLNLFQKLILKSNCEWCLIT